MAKYTAKQIKQWDCAANIDGKWIPARPFTHFADTIASRVKQAWMVLIGRFDALDWEDH